MRGTGPSFCNKKCWPATTCWPSRTGTGCRPEASRAGSWATSITEMTSWPARSVVEGDQETALDADRMRRAGCRVVQVNTGTGCHLDAAMVSQALQSLDPPAGSMVVIENVGNLVCPALFDLGEAHRIVLASVAEGADKPVKYPH